MIKLIKWLTLLISILKFYLSRNQKSETAQTTSYLIELLTYIVSYFLI